MPIEGLELTNQQIKGYKKTSRQAESAAFMCLLVYFTVKICTILIFYNWKNVLWGDFRAVGVFVVLIFVNTYFMLTTGSNPGFQERKITKEQKEALSIQIISQNQGNNPQKQLQQQGCIPFSEQESQSLTNNSQHMSDSISTFHSPQTYQANPTSSQLQQRFCKICQCLKRNRMKHCYACGRCIMKFDHHCPWIGSCVGELNHGRFVASLLAHALQATFTLYIIQCLNSLEFYQYYDEATQTFSTEFGVLILWSIFMAMYILFAGGLFLFHSYLIAANLTTRELVSRRKCSYLKNVKGNPFDEGVIKNLVYAISPQQNGRQWIIIQKPSDIDSGKNWYSKIFKNQYYECC